VSVSQGWAVSHERISVPELLSLHFRRYFLGFRVLTLIKNVFQLLVCPIGGFSPGSGSGDAEPLGLPGSGRAGLELRVLVAADYDARPVPRDLPVTAPRRRYAAPGRKTWTASRDRDQVHPADATGHLAALVPKVALGYGCGCFVCCR